MSNDIKTILKDRLPIGTRLNKQVEPEKQEKLSLAIVDSVADELVREYGNPEFRRWYCGVIYKFGLDRVEQWRRRASEGKQPARLFSTYVKQAEKYSPSKSEIGS